MTAARSGEKATVPILILGLLIAVVPMSIDMYLPSLPTIARDFDTSAEAVQRTLAAFFIGGALGQLFYGPLSDRFGRRRLMLVGLGVYVVAALLCALSASVEQLIALRLVQALGSAAAQVLCRAIVRDIYSLDAAARALSLMMLVMSAAPLIAPFIGGYLLLWFGWRSIFVLLAVFGLICWLTVMFAVPETLPPERRRRANMAGVFLNYFRVLQHRRAIGAQLSHAGAYAGMFSYFAGAPFVYIEYFGVPAEQFAYYFSINVLSLIAMSYLNSRLVMRFGADKMFAIGAVGVGAAGLLVLAACLVGNFWPIVGTIFIYFFAMNAVGPNATARALSFFPDIAGTAAAMGGALPMLGGALVGVLVGLLHDGTPFALGVVMAGCGVFCFAARFLLARERPGDNIAAS